MGGKIRIVTIKSLFGLCRLGVVLVGLVGLLVVVGSAQAVLDAADDHPNQWCSKRFVWRFGCVVE